MRRGEHLLGVFGSNQLSLRHLPALSVAADCAQAEVANVYANRDPDAAFESVVGQWALCDAAHRLSLAGVEIRDDRTWSAILPGDDLPLGPVPTGKASSESTPRACATGSP